MKYFNLLFYSAISVFVFILGEVTRKIYYYFLIKDIGQEQFNLVEPVISSTWGFLCVVIGCLSIVTYIVTDWSNKKFIK